VAGDVGIATFKMMLVNMLEGRFISPYDYEIATRIATVLCGGEIDRGSLVDEDWLLKLERSTSSNWPSRKRPRPASPTC
jgi:3-hydroxyacyl-CoA dehydrogenase